MKPSDYRCEYCGHIHEHFIENKDKFPEDIKCPECGKTANRIISNFSTICHQGKCGNSKNGYTSNKVSIKKT
jgi:putative FmdB family regulatory protein